ncbi:MAG TPA: aldehyde dehydrogenase family protein [Propionibacteriaceae bacterium]|nr:aldehyde dehydrogenase family protein [Propionibacteriaceae bacterium]
MAPALATGCTMVLKPSEVAPFSGQILQRSWTRRWCRRVCSTSSWRRAGRRGGARSELRRARPHAGPDQSRSWL